ncbi:hypothetical protein JW978_02835 [Candidatus Dojkabacteria bacterium]|nr:hypothetical protein [Candidatus Dojkabacteria bacterium]
MSSPLAYQEYGPGIERKTFEQLDHLQKINETETFFGTRVYTELSDGDDADPYWNHGSRFFKQYLFDATEPTNSTTGAFVNWVCENQSGYSDYVLAKCPGLGSIPDRFFEFVNAALTDISDSSKLYTVVE